MSVQPDERVIEVQCGAEDVTVTVMGKDGVTTISFDRCPWDGDVTEYLYAHAGIAEWRCPLCSTTHQRDLR